MFILREINSNGLEANTLIGEHYTFISRDRNPDEFRDTFKRTFEIDHVADSDPTATNYTKQTYGFVVTPNHVYPLYKDEAYFIMLGSGKTFSNLSYR